MRESRLHDVADLWEREPLVTKRALPIMCFLQFSAYPRCFLTAGVLLTTNRHQPGWRNYVVAFVADGLEFFVAINTSGKILSQ